MAKRTWEQEKAYKAKRTAQAVEEMEAAIETRDPKRFEAAWAVAMMYSNAKTRWPYYRRALESHLWSGGAKNV